MRAAAAQAQQAATGAGATGSTLFGQAQGTGQVLDPFLKSVVQSGMTPFQMNQAQVRAEQGSGGALSGVQGQGFLQAMRNRNPGGISMMMDQAAKEKMAADRATGLDISQMALNRQMQGAGMLGNLYGQQLGAAMKAYGLIPEDIDAEARANQTGWVQNLAALMGGGGSAAGGAAALAKAV